MPALDTIGLPALGLAMFAAMCVAAWLAARLRTALGGSAGDNPVEGYLLSATLALLGLLIAFTFSLAVSRFDARRAMVVAEANAIGTAWLRAGFAKGGGTDPALQQAIAAYADVRLRLSRGEEDAAVERATGPAQAAVRARLAEAVRGTDPPIAAIIITAIGEMFDAASARHAERSARLPGEVVFVLLVYAIVAAGIVGYVIGQSRRRDAIVGAILYALLAMAITLILDLDRPMSGAITVDQAPMLAVRAAMD
jgi:hypothetical protein